MDFTEFRDLVLSLEAVEARNGERACLGLLNDALRELTAQRTLLGAEEDKREMARFRELLHPILLQSDFGAHVFQKPRGHAGDYVTQEMIWFGRTIGGEHRYRGSTSLGKLLTSLTFDMPNCVGNEERVRMLQRRVASSARIASIGCGSGIEYWDQNEMKGCDVLLLDQDAEALAQARAKINRDIGKVTFQCQNVLKFILRRDLGEAFGRRDLVYASGLFDYFDHASARRLTGGLWRLVAPGGSLLVINEHPDNPTRLWMEYVGDWFLFYKSADQMRGLAGGLDGVEAVSLTVDSQGVYQYLEIRRNGSAARY